MVAGLAASHVLASDIVEAVGAEMSLYRSSLGGLGVRLTLPSARLGASAGE